MKYGKIRIEDGFLVFTRHMMINNLPCKDIVWAYMRKEGADEGDDRQLSVNYLVIVTRRKKRYKFDMTEKEIHECIRILKILNPDMATGFPKGAGYLFIVCRIPEIWVRSLQLMIDTSCEEASEKRGTLSHFRER